ncbi:glycosyltransferase family protein [Streptomyces sp. WZ-12]|uniref:glycosyltransferase family protein n=1 Tax=Streptomyces sp. WZ-12 TaxID=3030210 RepID=UPI002381238E|nr:glycosyltransferase [Streptomyces sp. WZ-12]
MRVAYVGNFKPAYSTENDVRKAFEFLGHQVIPLQENSTRWARVRETALASDLLLWTGTWDDAQPLRESLDTLRRCAMAGVRTATLHLDIFHGSDRGARQWWLHPMFFTSHVFTADGSHQDRWRDMGVNHHWLRPGIRHDAAHFGKAHARHACNVAFVGSNGNGYHSKAWPYRKQVVDSLRLMCVRNNWSWRNPGGDHPKVERGEALNDFYASAGVTVGDSLCLDHEKTLYCSDRVYETTGRGGYLIMPEIDFLKGDFDGLLPMYKWGDFDNLERIIEHALVDHQARSSARSRMHRIVLERHTYVHRVSEMLAILGGE